MSRINLPDITPLWVICTIPRLVTIHYKQRSIDTCILCMCVCAQHPHQTTRMYLFNGSSAVHVHSKAEQNVYAVPPHCHFTFFTIPYPEMFQIFFEDWIPCITWDHKLNSSNISRLLGFCSVSVLCMFRRFGSTSSSPLRMEAVDSQKYENKRGTIGCVKHSEEIIT